jgi:hypothetical protein
MDSLRTIDWKKVATTVKTMLGEEVKVVNFMKDHPLNLCILMLFVKRLREHEQ